MPPIAKKKHVPAPRPLRVGFLPLTDAAPLVVAEELGFFAKRGLRVSLSRQVGWATIREKILYGELDAAHALAPMLWATRLGLGCAPQPVLTAFVLNLHGNALTLSQALWNEGVRDIPTLRDRARARRATHPMTFGVVFLFSSHHLHLCEWLRASSIDPARDVRIVIVPPAQMYRNLAAGTIDGYFAGEPWNSLAVREGTGWCPAWSSALHPGHPEKVLMVTQHFAETRPDEHGALIAALAQACAWCDRPENRAPLAELLADARYLNLAARVIAPALTGRFDCGHGRLENIPDFHVFHRNEANVPTQARASALQASLVEAKLLPEVLVTPSLSREIFREDIYHEALVGHEVLNPGAATGR